MGARMFRKGLAVAVILLFIGTTISSSAGFNLEKQSTIATFERTTLYVDDDFNESTPGWNVTHFATINRARDNAIDGDTIFVYSGTYGRFHVRKSIQIIGENKYTTILDGNWNYNTISIETDNFLIKGFTVIKGKYGISLQQRNNVVVSDMILTNNDLGIKHFWNRNTHLDNITFQYNNGKALDIWDAKNCTISHCTFINDGIYHGGFPPSGSNSLFIRNNVFTNSSTLGLGYLCIESHGNTTIESNLFENNSCGISTNLCQGVNIMRNNFINNIKNVQIDKESYIRDIRHYISFKQHWKNNYWDDWNQNGSYAIQGDWTLYIGFGRFTFPIFTVPFNEYDDYPAQEPYDI